jgi:polysaccharide biosynthesis protein PslF
MKVLVISATFPPIKSGGANYAFYFCQHLARRGSEVHVLTSQIKNVLTDTGLRVHPLMRDWSWGELPKLLRLMRDVRPDIVNLHFHGLLYHNHPMITFALTAAKRLLRGVRAVTLIEYPEGISLNLEGGLAKLTYRAAAHLAGVKGLSQSYGSLLRDSDRLILLSGSHSRELSRHLPGVAEKCVVIPPPPLLRMSAEADGTTRRRGRETLSVTEDQFLIIYFGYIYPRKGIETLLEALGEISKRRRNVRLVIVGGSNEVLLKAADRPRYAEELRELAGKLGVSDVVFWTGHCPDDTDHISVYFRSADACVLPFEAGVYLNNSTFSAAAAHGLPIITTAPETLDPGFVDGENVYLCPPKDPEAIAAAVELLMDDAGLRTRLGAGALRLARSHLSWDRVMERTLRVFEGGIPTGGLL